MRLLLIRHGETLDNVNGELGTVIPGPPLTDLGRQQAAAIPAALAAESIDAIYVSRMRRTAETATPLAQARGLDLVTVDGIHEISAGEFEGRGDKEAIHAYLSTIMSWWHDFSNSLPGGESGTEFYDRYTAAIDAIAAEHNGTVAVFSHGAAIRTWASWTSSNIDESFSRGHHLPNTAMIVLEGSPETGWECVTWDGNPLGGEALDDVAAPDPTAGATSH
jgi:broad specificity phosphatase PhoE